MPEQGDPVAWSQENRKMFSHWEDRFPIDREDRNKDFLSLISWICGSKPARVSEPILPAHRQRSMAFHQITLSHS